MHLSHQSLISLYNFSQKHTWHFTLRSHTKSPNTSNENFKIVFCISFMVICCSVGVQTLCQMLMLQMTQDYTPCVSSLGWAHESMWHLLLGNYTDSLSTSGLSLRCWAWCSWQWTVIGPLPTSETCSQNVGGWALCSSSDCSRPKVPRSSNKYRARSFSISAPTLWNTLPQYIRELDTFTSFKAALKTHLFCDHFN